MGRGGAKVTSNTDLLSATAESDTVLLYFLEVVASSCNWRVLFSFTDITSYIIKLIFTYIVNIYLHYHLSLQ